MSLIQRLKGLGTTAVLGAALAGPVVYASGCLPLAVVGGAVILADAERDAARINAQSRENAARVGNGGGNDKRINENLNNSGNANRFILPSNIKFSPMQSEFFACNGYRGDLNGNGYQDEEEFEGYNKTIFKRNEPIMIMFLIIIMSR